MDVNIYSSVTSSCGFIAVGTTEFKTAMFDNLRITCTNILNSQENSTEKGNDLMFSQAHKKIFGYVPSSDKL